MTQEQQQQIRELYHNGENMYFSCRTESQDGVDCHYININAESIRTKKPVLQTYIEIAQILNCENGDEIEHTFETDCMGCPTCGYGEETSHDITLKFW